MKNYILDTNVLLHDPDALKNFQENHVLLPIEVIEEIDKFKREYNVQSIDGLPALEVFDRPQ